MEIVIAILLLVIAVQLRYVLKYLKHTSNLVGRIEGGLIGNGYGGLSKLSNLDYIHKELEKLANSKKESK
jgi:hypothetical protein